jgi:hypothetical protein
MSRYWRTALFIILLVPAACDRRASNDSATAAEIERKVIAAHPDLSMKRFAQFYARESSGTVTAVYLFANEGYQPPEGRAGQSTWTAPEKLPVVEDAGCAVITVKYDPSHQKLSSVACNGDVTDGNAVTLP